MCIRDREKTGEVFFGVSVIGGVDESGNELPTIYQPQYEKRGLPGAVYEIVAAEDIITQDGTVRNQKGEVVDPVSYTHLIKGYLSRYAKDPDITDVWIWYEQTGTGSFEVYIGYA